MNKPEPTALPIVIRVPLRCGGKGGACAAPILMPIDKFANAAILKNALEGAGWGVVTHGLIEGGQAIPLVDPACPECWVIYQAEQAQAKMKAGAGDAAAAAIEAAGVEDDNNGVTAVQP